MRFWILAAALAAAGCSDRGTSAKSEATADTAGYAAAPSMAPAPPRPEGGARELSVGAVRQAPPAAPPQTTDAQQSIVPSMLIRTGDAMVEVRDLDSAVAAAQRLVASLGGFVGGMTVQGGRESMREATLTLKLPAARFDQAMTGLGGLGKVERQSSSTEDVGEEYADISARIANSRRLEERLIDLLARRTGKLEEVLAVERELSRVREEIERMEGRTRYLRSRAAVSTLTLNLHEPRPLVGGAGRNPIVEAFRDAWRNFVGFVAGFISSLGVLVPLGVILAGLAWLGRRLGWFRRPAAPPPARKDPPAE
jgi:hypothetical protein